MHIRKFWIDLNVSCMNENYFVSKKLAAANCDLAQSTSIHKPYSDLVMLTDLVSSLKDHWRLLCSHQRSLLVLVSAA